MTTAPSTLSDILGSVPVIPVLKVEEPRAAVALGEALCSGGLSVLEVTLRTPKALECIQAMVRALPDAVVGAGTVVTPAQLSEVRSAGARFAVSPGLTAKLAAASPFEDCPLLPGVATASELMRGMEAGFRIFKLFPAGAIGGITLLKAFNGPFSQARFCPTGGINQGNMANYLRLPNVICVGGSWPQEGAENGDWQRVRRQSEASLQVAKDAGWVPSP